MKVKFLVEVELIFADQEIKQLFILRYGSRHLFKVLRVMLTEHHELEVVFLQFGEHLLQIRSVIQVDLCLRLRSLPLESYVQRA